MLERMSKLDPASRDPGMLLAAHLEQRVFGQRLPGFLDLPLPGEHEARKNQRLRLAPALHKTSIDKKLVNADFGHSWRVGAGTWLRNRAP
jgi:hypothetical protein